MQRFAAHASDGQLGMPQAGFVLTFLFQACRSCLICDDIFVGS